MRTFFVAGKSVAVLTLLVTASLSSCKFLNRESIDGNGKITTSERSVGDFNRVEVGGAIEVHVQQSPSASVKIETDENLIQYIDITNEKGTLEIRPKEGYNLDPSKDLIVYVAAPEYKYLEVSGASKMFGDNTISGKELEMHVTGASELSMEVKMDELKAELSGASTLQLKGSSNTISTEASGASNIKCIDLTTDETNLDLSGASEAEVSANKQLNIDASGASNVKYRGDANINQKSSGASSVSKVS